MDTLACLLFEICLRGMKEWFEQKSGINRALSEKGAVRAAFTPLSPLAAGRGRGWGGLSAVITVSIIRA
jgi:hypothetical protein